MISINKLIISLCIILTVLLNLPAQAQSDHTFNLQEAQTYALKHNRDIRNAGLGIEAANKQLWEVASAGFPQIDFSAQYTKMLDIPTQLIPGEIFGGEPGSTIPVQFGKPHLANYGVSISQLLFNGSYFVGLNASKIYLQLSEENLEKTQWDIKALVTNTYYLIMVGEKTREVIVQTLDNLKQTQTEIVELNKEGFNEESDVKQIQISVNALDNALKSIDQQIDVSYKLLNFQMGIPLEEPVTLTENLADIIEELDIKTPLQREFNVEENIGFKAISTQVKLSELSYQNEIATFYPTLALFASFQRDAQRDSFNIFDWNKKWYPTSLIGIQLSWPLFNGGERIYRTQKAKIELRQAEIKLIDVRDGLKLAHRQARTALEAARDQYTNARDNRDLAQEIFDINTQKYREGLVSSLELTQAQNQYLNAEQTYLQNLADALTAYTQLKKVLQIL
jgi:outer membrane protein TolC